MTVSVTFSAARAFILLRLNLLLVGTEFQENIPLAYLTEIFLYIHVVNFGFNDHIEKIKKMFTVNTVRYKGTN